MRIAIDCALQHIKIFREQALNGGRADFGEPCQTCIYADNCNLDWFSVLAPLINQSGITVSMVQGQTQRQDKSP